MDTFSALADPTRRDILTLLAGSGQLAATDIYGHFPVSPPAISQHLKVLRETRLVEVERQAQKRLYSLNFATLQEVNTWVKELNHLWEQRFQRLDQVLRTQTGGRHE